jgi:hypothetical protein
MKTTLQTIQTLSALLGLRPLLTFHHCPTDDARPVWGRVAFELEIARNAAFVVSEPFSKPSSVYCPPCARDPEQSITQITLSRDDLVVSGAATPRQC